MPSGTRVITPRAAPPREPRDPSNAPRPARADARSTPGHRRSWPAAGVAGLAALALTACEALEEDPPPLTEPPCPEGQILDGDVCGPERCGAGPWGDLEHGADTVHVAGWGEDDGDGSEDRPLRQIAPAVDLALSGDKTAIVVAEGEYESHLSFGAETAGFSLRGRCSDLVVLEGSDLERVAIWVHEEGDLTASGMRMRGDGHGVEVASGPSGLSSFDGEDLVVEGCVGSGFDTVGANARMTLRDVAVRDCHQLGMFSALGVWVDGGRMSIDGLEIDGIEGVGLYVGGSDSELELLNASIARVEPAKGGTGGFGMVVDGGATVSAERTSFADLIGNGILLQGAGSRMTVVDFSVERVVPGGTGDGVGVMVQSDASLSADGLVIRDVEYIGLFGTEDVSIELHDAVIEDVLPSTTYPDGGGVGLRNGAALVGEGIQITRTVQTGLRAEGGTTTVDVADLVVRDVIPSPLDIAHAVAVLGGASLLAQDLLIEDTPGSGVVVVAGGSAVLERPTVRDTRPPADTDLAQGCYFAQGNGSSLVATDVLAERCSRVGLGVSLNARLEVHGGLVSEPQNEAENLGRGVSVQNGGTLIAADLRVQGHPGTGIVAVEGGTIEVEGVVVADPAGDQDDEGGRGMQIALGSTLTGSDLVLQGNRGEGLVVWESTAVLDGLTVADTVRRRTNGSAAGLVLLFNGDLTASRVLVEGNDTLGVMADAGATVELSDGVIRDSRPAADGGYGHAVQVTGGGTAVLRNMEVSDVHNIGVLAAGGHVELHDVTVEQVHAGNHLGGAIGVIAEGESTVDLQRTTVRDIDGPALYVADAVLHCVDCALQNTQFAAIAAIGGVIAFEGGSVEDVAPSEDLGGGVGLYARPSPQPPQLTFTGTEFRRTVGPALYLIGAGRYDFEDVLMTEPSAPARAPGVMALDGVPAWTGAEGLRISGGEISGFGHVGVLLEASGARLDGVGFSDLGGIDVFRQHCDDVLLPLEVLSGSPTVGSCDGTPYDTAPVLSFQLELLDFLEVEP